MRDTFPCLQQAGTGLFKAKGSKFHGYAFPLPFHDEAAAERAVDEHLEAVRKEHHAARHVCYAWQFGPARFRAADDGEPGGSAGAPIHGVLRAHDLHWTLIAVVRYFGGVKLGVGGLIEAYREAGRAAVANAGLSHNVLKLPMTFGYPADLTRHVMQAIQQAGADIVAERYTDRCLLDLAVAAGDADPLTRTLLNIHGVDLVEPKTPPSS